MSRENRKTFLKISIPLLAIIFGTAGILPGGLLIIRLNSDEYWTNITPKLVQMDSELLDDMINDVEINDYNVYSIIIIRNGFIVTEWYDDSHGKNSLFRVYSASKSIASALIGIAIDKGFIDGVNELVLDFFPEKNISNLDPLKESITIEHLLTMTTGLNWPENYPNSDPRKITHEWRASYDWVQFVLDRPMLFPPGLVFNYNTGASYLLTAILERTTNMSTLDFANKYLFGPLSIKDAFWMVDPQGIAQGGNGLLINSRDMAKIGYLYLKEGVWEGKRIISSSWIKSSTTSKTIVEYGYQWWIRPEYELYRASGYGTQQINVFYKKDLIVVFTGMNIEFNYDSYLIDSYILPAII